MSTEHHASFAPRPSTPPVQRVGGLVQEGNTDAPAFDGLKADAGEGEQIPFSRPATPSARHVSYAMVIDWQNRRADEQDQLAFIGLGAMGKRMATNLALDLDKKGLPPLIVYNRGQARLGEFETWAQAHGCDKELYRVEKDLQEIGRTADIVLTSLSSDDAVEAVLSELFKGQETQRDKGDGILPGGSGRTTIFIDTSTIHPSKAGQLERLASSKPHRTFLSCPAFGVPNAAENAQLILAISGDYFAKKHAAHALVPAIAKKVLDLGSNVERAMSFKLIGNALELGFIELLSECLTLSEQAGVGSDKLVELIRDQHASPALVRYADRIANNKFDAEGGFNLGGGIADARHIRQLAESHNVPMPTIDVASQHMLSARAHGGDDLDWTALVGGQRIAAGLQPFVGRRKLERYYED